MAAQNSQAQSLPPIWERSQNPAIKLRVHRTGNDRDGAKGVSINRRQVHNFDTWLDIMTKYFRATDPIVRVWTPVTGTRVQNLDVVKDGDRLVLGTLRERFHKLSYDDTPARKLHQKPKSMEVPANHNARFNFSAKYKKVDIQYKRIYCWKNNFASPPVTVLVPPKGSSQYKLETVLNRVHDAMAHKFLGVKVSRLFTKEGEEVMSMEQIEEDDHFVGLNDSEHFKHMDYPVSEPARFSNSPRRDPVRFPDITRSNKTSSQSTPDHSTTSNGSEKSYNSYTQRHRREKAKREENGVFHNKPVKYKRSSEKVRQTNYDEDNGGVFKAKNPNKATKGAQEVQDSRHTKTDVPIDQQRAEEVQEDVKGKDKKGKKQTDNTYDNGGGGYTSQSPQNSPPPPAQQQQTYRSNARRTQDSPPANSQSQQDARAKREAEDKKRLEKRQQEQEKRRQKTQQQQQQQGQGKKNGRNEEEDRRREEDAQRRREQVEDERQRRADEDRRLREEEDQKKKGKKGDSTPNGKQAKGGNRDRDSPYRSGTDMVRDDDDNNKDDWDHRTPTPSKGQKKDEDKYDDDDGGLEDWDLDREAREEKEKAATTIQAHYRGFKARRDYQADRLQ